MIENLRLTFPNVRGSVGSFIGRVFLGERASGVRWRLWGRLTRVGGSGALILQTAVAASAAWYLASLVLGHDKPFVAAIAAVITLGATSGREGRRAIEWVLAVAVGLTVADLVVLVTGFGILQIAAVVGAAMVTAKFLGRGEMLATEAGVSAVLVVGLDPSTAGPTPDRFVDALVGCAVALGVHALSPLNPGRVVEKAARPIFDDLSGALEKTADALATGDPVRAQQALDAARGIDAEVLDLKEALDAGYEDARISPSGSRSLGRLHSYAATADQIDLAVRNTRVLARAAVQATRAGKAAPEPLSEAVRDLARAVGALSGKFQERPDRRLRADAGMHDEIDPDGDAGRLALEAAGGAMAVLRERSDLTTSMLVGQVRSTSVDLLRASGMDREAALAALEEATRETTPEMTRDEDL